ncbi:unnamed protein product [Darwinula stevensoni]|uniref:S1 motif domain-containing protein n=1 Tax=Darwinula stevensoni TaxID=69355 RepID=A0A7R8X9D7_9CRUS|nr:unnamed protein product [Darwinula stevensoni]CAG0884412.1 unnamed protein product [Darwinula stevensoni]
MGEILYHDVIHPCLAKSCPSDRASQVLKHALTLHKCETIAVGNGIGCREVEKWLSGLIQMGHFSPLNVSYTIVNESGVSIYSCSKEAKAEFSSLDPTLISAVSLARRLQDPLSEYVKVEPQHLGVGMYQHDISQTSLRLKLQSVVVDCVSFVGADLNSASEVILQKVSGLNQGTAKRIVEWRKENGPFINRTQLHLVKGIGPKAFQQSIGFLRILPPSLHPPIPLLSAKSSNNTKLIQPKNKKLPVVIHQTPEPLDRTWIHPETYFIANGIMKLIGVDPAGIGSESFIQKVNAFKEHADIPGLASEFGGGEPTIEFILLGLSQQIDADFRSQFEKPLFRQGLVSMRQISPGHVLSGQVKNVTHFGAFVDVGMETDGLIHESRLHHLPFSIQVSDRIEVRVLHVDQQRKRIQLDFVALLS